MTQGISEELWTFERFHAGQGFGAIEVTLDAQRVAGWEAVYGPIKGSVAPDGLIVAGMMEAYLLAIQPRPNGNVHASQKLAFTGEQAALDDTITYCVKIAKAEQKKGRFWVSFLISATLDGRALMQGELVSIWAA